ncbi:hypothetical protein GCM10023322_69490 [Rugosimonospora acidiphila]|uniref:DUF916 domain-containing protein n=1 Tax=Rugosimonospora acidiphila TaxID=556531 RepID=A0ABP9SM71_9ACTN
MAAPTADPPSLSIRVLDVPTARIDDPRALAYIIDFLNPGDTIRRRVEVKNTSPQTQHVDMYAGAAAVVNDTFTPATAPPEEDLTGWVSLDSPSLDLKAGATQNVWATITVPRDAVKGERYGAIWAQISRPPKPGSTVGENNRVGVRMYLDIGPGGEPPTDFRIGDITISGGHGPWPLVTARVDNTGGRAIDMTGSLTLTNDDGSVKAGPFEVTNGVTILPGQSGPVQVPIDKQLPAGAWTAKLTLASGTTTRTASATFTLPVAGTRAAIMASGTPWTKLGAAATLAVLLIVAALLLTRYLLRRRGNPGQPRHRRTRRATAPFAAREFR